MKKRSKPDKMVSRIPVSEIGVVIFFLVALMALGMTYPDLVQKNKIQNQNRHVSLAIDWEDVKKAAHPSNKSLKAHLSDLTFIPALYVVVHPNIVPTDLTLVRNQGFKIIWKWEPLAHSNPATEFSRFESGEGVIGVGENAMGYPRYLNEVAEAIRDKSLFLAKIEFVPQKGFSSLAHLVHGQIVKGHCLQAKERLNERSYLWFPRLKRAVKNRWVRLLYIQFSPNLSWNKNVQFLKDVSLQMKTDGNEIHSVSPFPQWKPKRVVLSDSIRLKLIPFIGLFGPLVLLWCCRKWMNQSPFVNYFLISVLSMGLGIVINSLGSFSNLVLGINSIRGVKFLIIIPFLLVGLLLLRNNEIKEGLSRPITYGHGLLFLGIFGLFLGGYLIRSGNFPVIPVPEFERVFRDGLEELFGVRPRFKEFLIGHPLLILGLVLQSRSNPERPDFIKDGRIWIWLGWVGQISILNTFLHFHSPLMSGILRTFHGWWLGLLVSLPVCYLYLKYFKKDSPS